MGYLDHDWISSKDNFVFEFLAANTYQVYIVADELEFVYCSSGNNAHRSIGEYVTAESKVYSGGTPFPNTCSLIFVFTCTG